VQDVAAYFKIVEALPDFRRNKAEKSAGGVKNSLLFVLASEKMPREDRLLSISLLTGSCGDMLLAGIFIGMQVCPVLNPLVQASDSFTCTAQDTVPVGSSEGRGAVVMVWVKLACRGLHWKTVIALSLTTFAQMPASMC
jgi:hypothetical protein